jgi:hypothetical protein
MDLRYLDMASDIRCQNERSQLLMGIEGVDPTICHFYQISEMKYKYFVLYFAKFKAFI